MYPPHIEPNTFERLQIKALIAHINEHGWEGLSMHRAEQALDSGVKLVDYIYKELVQAQQRNPASVIVKLLEVIERGRP